MGASPSSPQQAPVEEAGPSWLDGCICMCSDERDFEAASRGNHGGAHGPRRAFEADNGPVQRPAPWYLRLMPVWRHLSPPAPVPRPPVRSRVLDACFKQASFACGDHRRSRCSVASHISCRVSCAVGRPVRQINQATGCCGNLQRGLHALYLWGDCSAVTVCA